MIRQARALSRSPSKHLALKTESIGELGGSYFSATLTGQRKLGKHVSRMRSRALLTYAYS